MRYYLQNSAYWRTNYVTKLKMNIFFFERNSEPSTRPYLFKRRC